MCVQVQLYSGEEEEEEENKTILQLTQHIYIHK